MRATTGNFGLMMAFVDGGRFEVAGVQPGEYILLASAVVNQTNLHAEEKRLTVDGRDISGVTLTLEPGVSVSGRVQFTSAPPPELAARMRLEFRHVADRAYNIRGTTVAADGSGAFTVSGLRRGLYMIELVGVGSDSGWWMPSALVGGVDAADTPVEIGGSVTDVMVTVTNAPGEILGAAPSSTGSRVVVVFPVDRALWRPGSRRIAGVRPSSDGQYVVRRLPPGEYFVVATDGVEPGQWFNREFLESVAGPAATRVTLAGGERKRVDLK